MKNLDLSKLILKIFLRKLGYLICHTSTLGVNLENDLQRLTHNAPIKTIFDVGGNFGQSAVKFANEFPMAKIHSFEPVPSTFKILNAAIKKYSQIKSHELALSHQKGELEIGIANHPGQNSINLATSATEKITIKTDRLDNILKSLNIEVLDFLKIDVEGFELEVLKGAESAINNQSIRYIYAECVFGSEKVSTHTNFFELHSLLEKSGYAFICCYTQSFTLNNGNSMGNVLYGLKSKLPQSVPGSVKNIV